jgi:MYXO-CTERM domain-containing protein
MNRTRGLTFVMLVLSSCAAPGADDSAARVDHAAAVRALARVASIAYAHDGLPYMIRGELGRAAQPIDDVTDAARSLAHALEPLAATFGVRAADLVVTRVQHDDLGMTHVRYEQRKDGLPVVGGDFVVHVASDRTIVSINGSARDVGVLAPEPRISAETAQHVARMATLDGVNIVVAGSELVYVITSGDGKMHLAWQVQLLGTGGLLLDDLVYVDALDGAVVDRRPQVFTVKNREVRNGNNCSYPFGCGSSTLVGTEAMPPSEDAIAMAAFTNTGITYDCWSTLFARDSYDGNGAKLRSLVHVKFQTQNGTTGNNAAWAGNQMVYGDGDGVMMGPLANSLDVTTHELTHGVTGATAKLAYQNEPGALNEAMSDIIGAVCEAWHDGAVSGDTWLIGEDIFTPGTPGDALRYMDNPTADAALYPPQLGGSRDFYAERYQGSQDNGGVHLNSGIPNLAFHLLASGGKHPRDKTTFTVPGIGIEKAGRIFERALTQGYFTSNTNLAQARTQTEMVANQLYPGTAAKAVGLAWAAVGVGAPPVIDDMTPPTVSITAPADGATVDAGFVVTVQASDDVAVERVEILIDGVVAGTDTTEPYELATDSMLAPGSHTITATAYDLVNQASDTITVTIASGAACTTDAECEGAERCKEGTCVAPTSCTTDDECDGGDVCTGGACVPPGGSQTGDGGGCGCASSSTADGTAANLILLLGAIVIGRRRRR